jgi:hypothetical protein
LVGAAIGMVFWLKPVPPPDFRTLVVTEYVSPLFPALPFAENDANSLPGRHQFERQQADRIRPALENLKLVDTETAVFYFRSLAALHDGRVYLLPADASPDRPADWLPLGDLLAAADACASRHTLLLLDVAAPPADPRRGVTAQKVAAAVEKEVRSRSDARASVLCSCTAGQEPLPADPWAQSAFIHFVAEGLAGAADGQGPDHVQNGRVELVELAAFVRAKVDDWAWFTRRTRQTPELFGPEKADRQFALAAVGRDVHAADQQGDEQDRPPEYPKWLLEGWQLRDQWTRDQVFRVAPRAYRALDAYLTRAEQRWRGGRTAAVVEEDLVGPLRKLKAAAAAAVQNARVVEPRSLAALAVPPESKDAVADATAAIGELLDNLERAPDAERKDGVKKFLETWKAKLPPRLRAKAAFAAACAVAPGKDRARLLREILPHESGSSFAETAVLERIAAVRDVAADHWREIPFGRLLAAVQAEEVAIAGDPGAVGGFITELDQLAARRRKAEVDLVYERWEAGQTALEAVRERSSKIAGRVRAIGQARHELEIAAVFLPACAPYVAARADNPLDLAWSEAVSAGTTLYDLVDGTRPASDEELTTQSVKLHENLETLRAPFAAARLKELAERAEGEKAQPADFVEAQRLLDSPLPDAASRARLAVAVPALARRLYEAGSARKQEAREATPGPDPAGRRPDFTADLMRLAGLPAVADGSGAPEATTRALRELPARIRTATDGRAAARWSIALHPFYDSPDEVRTDPAARLAGEHARAFRDWLVKRYKEESGAYSAENFDRNGYKHEASAKFFLDASNSLR